MSLNLIEKENLPNGWALISLAEIRRKKSKSFNPAKEPNKTLELYSVPSHETKSPEVVRGSEIGSNKQYVEPGDVLVSKINPRLNRVWVVGNKTNFEKIASTEWIVFSKNGYIESSFLDYLLQSIQIRDYLAHNASGVGGSLMRIKPSFVDTISMGLPPLNEQKRIVAKIEALFAELDAGVASLKRAQAQLQTYRQALLKHAFEGKLTAEWRAANAGKLEDAETLLQRIKAERQARHEAELAAWKEEVKTWEANGKNGKKPAKPRPPKELPPLTPAELADLPQLPAGWAWVRPEEINSPEPYAIGIGPFGSNLKVADYREKGIPLIFVKNITRSDFSLDLKYIDNKKFQELHAHSVQPLDLLITHVTR